MRMDEMITEILKTQLSENLRISIEHESASDYRHAYIRVEVYFGGEIVASDMAFTND